MMNIPITRLTTVTDRLGKIYTFNDALAKVTELGYDTAGRLVSVTNPLGHTQTLEYDAVDNSLVRTPTCCVNTS